MRLPVISLWRPWAEWVLWGWKSFETRTHARFAKLAGQRIGIHAAQKWDNLALAVAEKYLEPWQIADTMLLNREPHPLGGHLLCTAQVYQHRLLRAEDSKLALIDCASTERYGLLLGDLQPTDRIVVNGRQGIFYVEYP